MSRILRLPWIALFVVCPVRMPIAIAACPDNILVCCGGNLISSSEPRRSHGCLCSSMYGGGGGASYDLISGDLSAYAQGAIEVWGEGLARVTDEYRVVGLPEGTPLDFFAGLKVIGSISGGPCTFYTCAYGDVSASVKDGATTESSIFVGTNPVCDESGLCRVPAIEVDSVLVIPIHRSAGEVFRLTFELQVGAGTYTTADASGQIRFSGLPPGASIVSCQGFIQEFPVPALPTTWGRIKAGYR